MKALLLALTLAAAAPSLAFASDTSARRYGSSEALSVQDARLGEVLLVREVRLKNDARINTGSAIGAAVGVGAARKVRGDYRSAARVAGGVIGGVAGTAIQNGLSNRLAVEVFVRDLADKRGRVVAIVQDADLDVRAGDRVFLVGKGKKTRVVPIPSTAVGSNSSTVFNGVSIGGPEPDDNSASDGSFDTTLGRNACAGDCGRPLFSIGGPEPANGGAR